MTNLQCDSRSDFKLQKNLSVGTLSQQLPFRLMLATIPYIFGNHGRPYWLPRSEWCSSPGDGFLRQYAIDRASRVSCLFIRLLWPSQNDLEGKEINHHDQIQPAFKGPDIGDVCCPDFIRTIDPKLTIQNGDCRKLIPAVRSDLELFKHFIAHPSANIDKQRWSKRGFYLKGM